MIFNFSIFYSIFILLVTNIHHKNESSGLNSDWALVCNLNFLQQVYECNSDEKSCLNIFKKTKGICFIQQVATRSVFNFLQVSSVIYVACDMHVDFYASWNY